MSAEPTTDKGAVSTAEQVVFRIRPATGKVGEIRKALSEATDALNRSARRLKPGWRRDTRLNQVKVLRQLHRDYTHF